MVQLLWSLHNIETLLCNITGKPPMIRQEDITIPFPGDARTQNSGAGAMEEASAAPLQEAQVCFSDLSQQVLLNLYAERRQPRQWVQVHTAITSLMSDLDDWAVQAMPAHLQGPDIDPRHDREQLHLKKNYYRLKILIARPCLYRIEKSIEAGDDNFSTVDRMYAEVCIQAANEAVELLPQTTNIPLLYEKSPWWTITHNLMQAGSILLIAISLRAHFSALIIESISNFRKVAVWLQAMRATSDIAERAYRFLHDIVRAASHEVWPEICDMFPDERLSMIQEQALAAPAPVLEEFHVPWHG